MSESPAQSGGTADPSQGGGKSETKTEEKPIEVNRTPEEYALSLKKTAEEAKKYRQENSDLKKQLEEFQQKTLQEQGNWKDLAEKAQKKNAELAAELKTTKGKFALKTVSDQLSTEALKLGCIDTDALIKLADLGALDVDEDFRVDGESLKSLLAEMQKNKPFLFKKPDPKIQDGLPPAKGASGGKKEIKDMSVDEKLAALANTFK